MRVIRGAVSAALLMLCLSGCSATTALSAATGLIGSKPDLSAQVGQENTKQGIGLNTKLDDSSATKVSDSTVGALDSSKSKAAKAQNISTGSITADRIEVKNTDSLAMIGAFLAGLIPMLLVELFLILKRKGASKDDTTS